MRFGYWLPVFGGWLRNVDDERMEATWAYVSRLARRSEEIGFDVTLIAELNLNDIKGMDAPSLDAPKNGLRVERADPPREIIEAIERISRATNLDVGGIEFLVDDRDGQWYVYDINALSNFVADAVNVVGFDPWLRLVDYLERRLEEAPLSAQRSALSAETVGA